MSNALRLFIVTLICLPHFNALADSEKITIGSKMQGESYLLGEMTALILENSGFEVDRKFGFGGTLICFNALKEGEIDLYSEYSGTISEVLLTAEEKSRAGSSLEELRNVMNVRGFDIFSPYGFNNSYVLTLKKTLSDQRNITKISHLRSHDDLRVSFSHEFLNRDDGWPALQKTYDLVFVPNGIQHGLAYKAMDKESIDITDAYSTDGDAERYGLQFLEDDLNFFPNYYGVSFTRLDFPKPAKVLLSKLENILDDQQMRALNAQVVVNQIPYAEVARNFLLEKNLIDLSGLSEQSTIFSSLMNNVIIHIKITLIALSIGCLVGLLAAFLIFRSAKISRYVIYFTGLLQTIPSIALLALMIPFLGIGEVPAIMALFLYSLLPILRSAITALSTIDPVLVSVSKAIGMTQLQQFRYVLFSLALPNILSGVKTAAVICIGTATLAAFIGAGGLGEPIVTGLALNDTNLILQGAIPAAVLAIIVELLFELLEIKLIPEHMRKAD